MVPVLVTFLVLWLLPLQMFLIYMLVAPEGLVCLEVHIVVMVAVAVEIHGS